MVIKSNKRIKPTKFQKLEREHRQLLGEERTLQRMIEKRMLKLNPLLSEVKRIRKDLEPIEQNLEVVKKKIKDVIDNNIFSPKISIVRKVLYKKRTYYYGKITFSKSQSRLAKESLRLRFLKDRLRLMVCREFTT